MKRFLPVMLVVLLVVSFAVPVSAAEVKQVYALSGKWYFNESITYPSFVAQPDAGQKTTVQEVDFYCGSTLYSSFRIIRTGEDVSFLFGFGNEARYSFDQGKWWASSSRKIDFDSVQFVSADFYEWFTANAIPRDCECVEMTDSNSDYTCDVCGLTVSENSRTYNYSESVTFRTASSEFIKVEYFSPAPINIRGYIDGSSYRVDCDSPVWVVSYTSANNYDWTRVYSAVLSTHFPSDNLEDEVIASTFDWYSSDNGDLFFPLPLWSTINNKTQGSLPSMSQVVGGAMTTLAVCGVGLVALLMVLNLFGKRSKIFPKK